MSSNESKVSKQPNNQPGSKPKKTKSRNGCVTCKKRRLKCDETKPFCQNCVKRGIVCGGYAINFKWRDFSDSLAPQKTNTPGSIQIQQNDQFIQPNQQPIQPQPSQSRPVKQILPQPQIQPHAQIQTQTRTRTQTQTQTQTQTKSQSQSQSQSQPQNQLPQPAPIQEKSDHLKKALEDATLSVTGKSTQEIAIANILISNGKNPELAAAIASTLVDLADSENIQQLLSSKQSKLDQMNANADDKVVINNELSANIQSKQLVVNNESNNSQQQTSRKELFDNSSQPATLHSLADIASKIPTSPAIPLSPFNEPSFPFDSFLGSNAKNKKLLNPTLIPQPKFLNLKKDSPQPLNMLSPIFPRSPNLSGFSLNYNSNNNNNNEPNAIHLNQHTPKFIDEMDTGFSQYTKFSPLNPDLLDSGKTSNSPRLGRFPMVSNQQNPTFYNMSSLLNNDSGATTLSQFSSLTTSSNNNEQSQNMNYSSIGVSPIFEIDTPRMLNQSNPASPYSTLLSFAANNNQVVDDRIKRFEDFDNINNSGNENAVIEEVYTSSTNNDSNKNYKSSNLIHRISFSSVTSDENDRNTNQASETNSPNSSSIDLVAHPDRRQFLFSQSPVNLYALHLPDEHLTTLIAFDQHTCGIMSIKNGPTENPWRTFLLPMSVDHPVVRSALLAMTCFHVARGDSVLRARGIKYMKDTIVSLVHGLSTDNQLITDNQNKLTNPAISKEMVKKTPPDVALATCIALAIGESWDRHISTGIAHLKGAKSMIVKVLNKVEGKKKNRKKRGYSMSSSHSVESASMSNSESINEDFESKSNSLTLNNSNSDKKLPKELQFLVNAWMYFDVLARMTNTNEEYDDDDDDENDNENEDNEENEENENNTHENAVDDERYSNTFKSSDNENAIVDDEINSVKSIPLERKSNSTSPSTKRLKLNSKKKKTKEPDSASVINKFRSFNLDDGDTIDPLLGVAQTLFPLMGEVATLISQVRRYKEKMLEKLGDGNSSNNTGLNSQKVKTPLRLISRTVELKSAIEHWKAPLLQNLQHIKQAEDPKFDLNAAVATAEAYRYSVLLYLHQAVPEVPSSTSHSLAENVMMLLASVPSSSSTLVTHIFPLFVASCEARPGEERAWAKERWVELVDKMWIGTIERAWEVVQEVWARKDALSFRKSTKNFNPNNVDNESNGNGSNGTLNNDPEFEYNKIKRRISMVIHGNDEDLVDDEASNVGNWTHWTTIMKEWGWEILLA